MSTLSLLIRKSDGNLLRSVSLLLLMYRPLSEMCTITQACAPLMLSMWMITHANVNFHSPVKLFSFQNTPVLNESLIVHGNKPLWSREEKEAIIEHAVEIYMTSNRQKKLSTKSCQWEIPLTLLTRSTQHLTKMKEVVRTVNLNFSKRNSKANWTEAIS